MANIKHLKPNSRSRYDQGYYDKYKPAKYVGERPIIYRSSYEKRFMATCELNPTVKKWSSEQIVIPYLMKTKINGKWVEKRHNYHTDFTVWTENGLVYVIEVKPDNQSPKNKQDIMRNPVLYKNYCKWKAALGWCKKHGYIFKIVTEKHLKTKIF